MFNKNEFNGLQIKQNKALRVILNCNVYTSINSMLNSTNILSVKQSVMLHVFMFIYKMLNNMLPKHLVESCTFVSDIHSYPTRSNQNFYIRNVRSTFSENQLFINGLKLYNDLPTSFKNSTNLNSFKKNCTEYVKLQWFI